MEYTRMRGRQKENKRFFSFTLHALAIIILLYAKEASCVEPHCCGEKERKETGIALSPVIHFCPVPSASHPSLCG